MMSLCRVRHNIDTSDKFYSDEQDYRDKTAPLIQGLENKLTSEYSKLKASTKIEIEGEIYNLASIASKTLSKDRDYDEIVKVRDRIDKINLCKLGGTKLFLGLLESCHLKSLFIDGCLKDVVKNMYNVLAQIDDK